MKMIRLMRLKGARQDELNHLYSLRDGLQEQLDAKELEILEVKKNVRLTEVSIGETGEKADKLLGQQDAVKKVEEFNALSQEIAATERQKVHKETQLNDLLEKLAEEEDRLDALKDSVRESQESSEAYEQEILESIGHINLEGKDLKTKRDALRGTADEEVLKIYERLLCNRKDRVIVPIQQRTCTGCHIVLTAQHENLVRRGERIVFCEHCSRIHYWQDAEGLEDSVVATKRRRRRSTVTQ